MAYILGENRDQSTLLPDNIDDYVDAENAVRVIDAYVDSLDLEALGFTKARSKDTGRPPYAPGDLLKLYIYGYMNRIRSSRRLEVETKRNLEVIWLMGKLSPDHKTIARFRHDNAKALKNVFRNFVKLCMQLDLYGKELVAIAGSKFKAVNSKERNFTVSKLKDRKGRLDAKIEEYLLQIDKADQLESETDGIQKTPHEIAAVISKLSQKKELYKSYAEDMAQKEETQKSLTDPDSRLMVSNGEMDICYNVQSAVDSKNKMVVHFDVTNKAQDQRQLPSMVEASVSALGVEKLNIVADKGYGGASDAVMGLSWELYLMLPV